MTASLPSDYKPNGLISTEFFDEPYFLSGLPLLLGIFWIAFDGRKQGWHDKLAGTVVVRQKNRQPKPVTFNR